MVDVPEHDPDTPRVPVSVGMPSQQWVEAAAHSLNVGTTLAAPLAPLQLADGDFIAVHAVRSPHGQIVTYAQAHESWTDGELTEVIVDGALPDVRAQRLAIDRLVADATVGAACVRVAAGSDVAQVAVGASAAAAWTIDGCATSLYENHVRALLDLPLGSPRLRRAAVVSCRIGAAPAMHAALRHCFARDPELRVHLYGFTAVPGMTIGHATVVADEVEDALRRARHAAEYLTGSIEE